MKKISKKIHSLLTSSKKSNVEPGKTKSGRASKVENADVTHQEVFERNIESSPDREKKILTGMQGALKSKQEKLAKKVFNIGFTKFKAAEQTTVSQNLQKELKGQMSEKYSLELDGGKRDFDLSEQFVKDLNRQTLKLVEPGKGELTLTTSDKGDEKVKSMLDFCGYDASKPHDSEENIEARKLLFELSITANQKPTIVCSDIAQSAIGFAPGSGKKEDPSYTLSKTLDGAISVTCESITDKDPNSHSDYTWINLAPNVEPDKMIVAVDDSSMVKNQVTVTLDTEALRKASFEDAIKNKADCWNINWDKTGFEAKLNKA